MGPATARAGDVGAAGAPASQWGCHEGRDLGLAFRAGSAPAWRPAAVVAVGLTRRRRRQAQDGLLAAGQEARAGLAVPTARRCQGQPVRDLVGGRFSAPATCPFPGRPEAMLGGLGTQVPATMRAKLGYQPPQKVEVREHPGPGVGELRGAMPSTACLSCRPPGPGGPRPLHHRVPRWRVSGERGWQERKAQSQHMQQRFAMNPNPPIPTVCICFQLRRLSRFLPGPGVTQALCPHLP